MLMVLLSKMTLTSVSSYILQKSSYFPRVSSVCVSSCCMCDLCNERGALSVLSLSLCMYVLVLRLRYRTRPAFWSAERHGRPLRVADAVPCASLPAIYVMLLESLAASANVFVFKRALVQHYRHGRRDATDAREQSSRWELSC